MPLPWMQANSPLDRFTPSSRYVLPAAVTMWLPETCRAGAGALYPPPPLGLLDGEEEGELEGEADGELDGEAEGDGEVLGVALGEVEPTVPLQRVPLRVKVAGTALVPEYEPLNPKLVVALVAIEPL